MTLRRDDSCTTCHSPTPAGSKAWWDKASRCVYCEACASAESEDRPAPLPTPPTVVSNTVPVLANAGASAQNEYDKRRATHDRKVEDKWGTGLIGGIAKVVIDEPQHVTAWKKGADGERRLSLSLRKRLGDSAIVLDDRQVPGTRGNIDHIVVASSGVWIVDAKNYKGKVEMRSGGSWRKPETLLFVNGRNQSKLVDGMGWQVAAVERALVEVGMGAAPIRPSLCFTNSEWPLFGGMGPIRGVWIGSVQKLVKEINKTPLLSDEQIRSIADGLHQQLPPVTG